MPIWFASLFCWALLFSATTQAQLQKIYLLPKSTASIMQSQIVDSIRFIPLQQKDGIELGMYSNVQITKDYFVVVDNVSKFILLYASTGKFVKSISFKKLGDNLYPAYHAQNNQLVFFGNNKNYLLTPKDRIGISLDWNNPRNKKYFKKFIINLSDTTFAIQKEVVEERDIMSAYAFEPNAYWSGKINTSPLYKDSIDYELKIFRNNKLVKTFFPYNRVNEPRFLFAEETAILTQSHVPGTYNVARPFCDTLYKITKDSIFPSYQLVMPLENAIPASFYNVPFKNKTERDNFKRNNGWMYHRFYPIYENDAFIYFGVNYMSNFGSYIYHKQSKITYQIKNVRPDSNQYNLKLLGDYGVTTMGNKLYKTLKAADLQAFFNQHKEVQMPGELKSFLQGKPQNNAPVLVEFTLKN